MHIFLPLKGAFDKYNIHFYEANSIENLIKKKFKNPFQNSSLFC